MTPILFIKTGFRRILKICDTIAGGFDLKKRKIHPAFWISISVGLLFMALGIWREEVMVLYQKAIYICMECIGLG